MPAPSICLQALDAFSRKDFTDWRGVPHGCGLAEVEQVFGAQDDWAGEAKLGLHAVGVRYRFFRLPLYVAQVCVFFRDQEIRLIEAEGPLDDVPLAELARQLGTPAARLDTWFGFARVDKGEWVYPGRGIAFSSDLSRRQIHRLWVFAATTLERYTEELRVNLRQTPIPEARP